MPSILSSITSMVTPELAERLAKILGGKSDLIAKGLKLLGPLLLAALGKKAASPDGSGALSGLLNLLPDYAADDTDGLIGDLVEGELGPQLVGGLLGGQSSAVAGSLARSSGVTGLGDLLQMAVPLGLARISKKMNDENLDADGLAAGLTTEFADLQKSDDESAKSVLTAFSDADAQDELKATIGEQAWAVLSSAPTLAAGYVAAASRPGFFADPLGSHKEMEALTSAFDPAGVVPGSTLVDGVVSSIQDSFATPAADGLPWELSDVDFDDDDQMETAVIDKLKLAVAALAAVPADEQARYKQLIVDAATKVAEAGKEGGILGLGGKKLSDDEAHALWNIQTVLGL